MELPERVRKNLDTLVVLALLLLCMALGYWVGNSGPYARYAQALEGVLQLKNMEIQSYQQQLTNAGSEAEAAWSDAARLLNNLVKVVEGESEQSQEEALAQAKSRLAEWGLGQ